jgi:hypothetical protein
MRDFIQLLEAVAEDGELSNSEIVAVAKWINEHQSSTDQWPVNEFVPLLRDVFADQKISIEESLEVGKLIMKTLREWQRRIGSDPDDEIIHELEELDSSFDSKVPKLISVPHETEIESSDGTSRFSVTLKNPSCTCSDFRNQRQNLPELHLSRCCKHIFAAYAQVRPESGWPGWLDIYLELGFRPKPSDQWHVFKFEGREYLVSNANPDWSNVYCKSELGDEKYGYSLVDGRWSYNNEPVHSGHLINKIVKLSN